MALRLQAVLGWRLGWWLGWRLGWWLGWRLGWRLHAELGGDLRQSRHGLVCAQVRAETDVELNSQSVIENGGRVTCVCAKASGCTSHAFANKLIAMIVPDELYERYLRARDYVVGKDAVAGALAKVKEQGSLGFVEQEQIRNLYRKADGSYSAYMCGKCSFGPIDHMACMDLKCHHGEKKGGGAGQINNACPKCKWFAATIDKWPAWDGEFRSVEESTGGPPPVEGLSVPALKAELNAAGLSCGGKKEDLQARLNAHYLATYGQPGKKQKTSGGGGSSSS